MKTSGQVRHVRPLASEPSQGPIEPRYLDTQQAAVYLQYASAASFRKAIAHGLTNRHGERIPVLFCGRQMRFDREAVDRWLHGEKSVPATPFDQKRTFGAERIHTSRGSR